MVFSNPLVEKTIPNEKDIEDLKEWSSFWDSVDHITKTRPDEAVSDLIKNTVVKNFDFTKVSWIYVINSVRASINAYFHSLVDTNTKEVEVSKKDDGWVTTKIGECVFKFRIIPIDAKYRQKVSRDFSCINSLRNKGLVPSFDGNTWRLHSGEKAEIVWEGSF